MVSFSKSCLIILIIMINFYMVYGDIITTPPQIIKDKAALLAFKNGVFSDPSNVLDSWNSSSSSKDHDVCTWVGVKCNEISDRVVELVLNHSLEGIISPSLSNITFLKVLNLSQNFFHGQIPYQIGSLHFLKLLSLSSNLLEGNIPMQLGYLLNLEYLDLSQNFFHGEIPYQIGSLHFLKLLSLSSNLLEGNIPIQLGYLLNLEYLDLGSNNLDGEIPKPLLCNSSNLQYIDLSNNSLSGEIPIDNTCDLRELEYLLLWSNDFVGEVPIALSNSSKLKWIDLALNSFNGELPSKILKKLHGLQYLYLGYNNFVSHNGNIDLNPFFSSLINATNLTGLDLAGNHFGGMLPSIIGDLSHNLLQINLDDNHIFGPIPPEISNLFNLTLLNLSSNFFNGSIPSALCKMEKLQRLYLSDNELTGNIPSEFGNLLHLGLIDLSKNKLSGTIPDSFANLSQLSNLLLYDNRLSGPIPQSLGKCISLDILDLSNNMISGQIPSEVAGLSNLKFYMNLSCNHLEGPIPMELSKMDMVLNIDLSYNYLSGPIPSQLGNCIALEYLNLSNNALKGNLPLSIGRLPNLKGFDISFNNLSGEIPRSFQLSTSLMMLNFSYNNFSGNVTKKGAFSYMNNYAFLGNSGLCGPFLGMQHCYRKGIRHFELAILVSTISVGVIFGIGYILALKLKVFRKLISKNRGIINRFDEETKVNEHKYPRITYRQLVEATDGFSSSWLIGLGTYGHVYKGILPDNTMIAVKVFTPETAGSFERECEVLRRTRHRNLIRIITICSTPDFKAIVLPLMTRGSLEDNLYPKHGLDLIQLVNICSDVAEGIAYLHHHAPVKVAHCDLKPSNILLDDDITALVTDFGISRFIKNVRDDNSIDDSVSYTSTDGLLRGSIGYIAPEYGMGRKASIEGDVFSYGIILLETITGRRPTDVLTEGSSSFQEWVKSYYQNKLEEIIESLMARCSPGSPVFDSDRERYRRVIIELIELGLICTQHKPSTRPTMMDVAHDIARLKDYLCNF